jgi:hypothetical protein
LSAEITRHYEFSASTFQCGHQLLNGGGWREPFVLKAAIRIGGSIGAFDARNAQHRQATAELRQFFPVEDSFGLGAAYHRTGEMI